MARADKKFNLKDPQDSWFPNMFDWTKEDIDEFWEKEHVNFLGNLPVRLFAKSVLQQLHNEGHKIIIVTQRYISDAFEISNKWLNDNGLVFDKLTVNAKDKVAVCKQENIAAFIDDRVATCNGLSENGINAFVMNVPKNLNEQTTCPRVDSFVQFYEGLNKGRLLDAPQTPELNKKL